MLALVSVPAFLCCHPPIVQVRLDAARAKATSIAAQEDMPMASKMREIEKVYAKAKAGGGAKGKGKGGKGAGGCGVGAVSGWGCW